MEVAGALAWSGIPIGVLAGEPATSWRVRSAFRSTSRRLLAGASRRSLKLIDLGVIRGRRFAVAAGVGIDAAMVEETPHWMKRRLGVLAYTLIAARAGLRA